MLKTEGVSYTYRWLKSLEAGGRGAIPADSGLGSLVPRGRSTTVMSKHNLRVEL